MSIEVDCYIEIPADKLRDAIKLAYDLSSPQGLGFFDYRKGSLDEKTVSEIINREQTDGRIAASMDYVHGRSCKFHVYRENNKLYIKSSWYDHGDYFLEQLLIGLGVEEPQVKITKAQKALQAANEKWERENARG